MRVRARGCRANRMVHLFYFSLQTLILPMKELAVDAILFCKVHPRHRVGHEEENSISNYSSTALLGLGPLCSC